MKSVNLEIYKLPKVNVNVVVNGNKIVMRGIF